MPIWQFDIGLKAGGLGDPPRKVESRELVVGYICTYVPWYIDSAQITEFSWSRILLST